MPRIEYALSNIDELPAEGSKVVDFFGRTVHVLRGSDGTPTAFMNVCMHFGGTLTCTNGEFLCEWHGATFDAKTGVRTGGPAEQGARLIRLPTVVRDGVVIYTFAWGDDA